MIYCYDANSLYPNCIIGMNSFSFATKDEPFWNGSGWYANKYQNFHDGIRGKYSRKRGPVEEFLEKILEEKNKCTDDPKRRLATKIILNTTYGALACQAFKHVYDKTRAADVTGMARMTILQAREVLKDYGTEVIYTDSVGKDSYIAIRYNGNIIHATIEELWNDASNGMFGSIHMFNSGDKEYIRFGDEIESLTMEDNLEITFRPLFHIMRHKINKQCIEIRQNNYRPLVTTKDHCLITYKDNTLKPIKSTEPCSLILNSGVTKKNKRSKINHAAEMLGYWIGNGSYSGKYCINFSCGHSAQEFIEKCLNHVVEFKDHKLSFNVKGDIKTSNSVLIEWMRSNGYTGNSKTKRIPEYVLESDLDYKLSFLRGLFSSDGTISNNRIIRYTSINIDLIKDIKLLLESVGVGSSIIKENNPNSYQGKVSKYCSYHVKISQMNNEYFKDNIGFITEDKQTKISKFSKRRYAFGSSKRNVVNYRGYVYDLEIDGTHRFFANDILVHNTDSVFVKTAKTVDEMNQIMSYIANEQKKGMNIASKNHSFKLECVIKHMYFFRDDKNEFIKKHYIYVTDEDKLVLKGLSIIKGNSSQIARIVFDKYIKPIVMKGKPLGLSYETVLKWVEKEIKDNPDRLIKRYRLRAPEEYKVPEGKDESTALNYRLARKYGPGEHWFVTNTKYGPGKGNHYTTMDELKEKAGKDWIQYIPVNPILNDLKPFIAVEERKKINKRK